jgi:hypothetical protein
LEHLIFQAYIVFDGMANNNFSKSSERQSSKEIIIITHVMQQDKEKSHKEKSKGVDLNLILKYFDNKIDGGSNHMSNSSIG